MTEVLSPFIMGLAIGAFAGLMAGINVGGFWVWMRMTKAKHDQADLEESQDIGPDHFPYTAPDLGPPTQEVLREDLEARDMALLAPAEVPPDVDQAIAHPESAPEPVEPPPFRPDPRQFQNEPTPPGMVP